MIHLDGVKVPLSLFRNLCKGSTKLECGCVVNKSLKKTKDGEYWIRHRGSSNKAKIKVPAQRLVAAVWHKDDRPYVHSTCDTPGCLNPNHLRFSDKPYFAVSAAKADYVNGNSIKDIELPRFVRYDMNIIKMLMETHNVPLEAIKGMFVPEAAYLIDKWVAKWGLEADVA